MKSERYLFEIPIYWCAESRFHARYDSDLRQHLDKFEKQTGYPLSEDLRMSLRRRQ